MARAIFLAIACAIVVSSPAFPQEPPGSDVKADSSRVADNNEGDADKKTAASTRSKKSAAAGEAGLRAAAPSKDAPPGSPTVMTAFSMLITGVLAAIVAYYGHRSLELFNEQKIRIEQQTLQQKSIAEAQQLELARQTQRHAQIEAERADLARQLEQGRQRAETLMNAVKLVGEDGTTQACKLKRGGALFALAKLDELDFSLTLLENMWPAELVDIYTAVLLVNQGLRSTSIETQDCAASILRDNTLRLLSDDGGYHWPSAADWDRPWNVEWDVITRESLLRAAIKIVPLRPKGEWDRDSLTGLYLVIENIRRGELAAKEKAYPGFVSAATRGAFSILQVLRERGITEIPIEGRYVPVEILTSELFAAVERLDARDIPEESATLVDHLEKLAEWADPTQAIHGAATPASTATPPNG